MQGAAASRSRSRQHALLGQRCLLRLTAAPCTQLAQARRACAARCGLRLRLAPGFHTRLLAPVAACGLQLHAAPCSRSGDGPWLRLRRAVAASTGVAREPPGLGCALRIAAARCTWLAQSRQGLGCALRIAACTLHLIHTSSTQRLQGLGCTLRLAACTLHFVCAFQTVVHFSSMSTFTP